MQRLEIADINKVISGYGLNAVKEVDFVDSSHGDEDIRHNYILDKRYVLRVNSAPVFTQERLEELNILIERYNDFGIKAPRFLRDKDGNYLHDIAGGYGYLSGYLDYPTADELEDERKPELIKERAILVAKYAEAYKNIGLIDTVSMYSIFDLSPYDKLAGVDEKQDNLNELTATLRQLGEENLASQYEKRNDEMREKLKAVYKELPRCVFQGDENFSNICVDESGRIIGLFDFNMSGTEVVANYLANLAFQGWFTYSDEIFAQNTAEEIYHRMLQSFDDSTKLMKENYAFTPAERDAYKWYGELVLISGYVNTCAWQHDLMQAETREKVLELLAMIVA